MAAAAMKEPLPIVLMILRASVSIVFVYAGVEKAMRPSDFAETIANFHLVSRPIGAAIALYLPYLEIICGIALLTYRFRAGSLLLLLIMSVLFMVVHLSAIWRDIDPKCGCLGANTSSNLSLLIDVMVIALLGSIHALGVAVSRPHSCSCPFD